MTRICIEIFAWTTALVLMLSLPLLAQPRCGPSIAVLQGLFNLGETIHETQTRPAQDGSGDVQWVMWVNEATGSWTLTGTQGGRTCLFAGQMGGYAGQAIADFFDVAL